MSLIRFSHCFDSQAASIHATDDTDHWCIFHGEDHTIQHQEHGQVVKILSVYRLKIGVSYSVGLRILPSPLKPR